MHVSNSILIAASPDIIFRLAADVEGWPGILPHYRWVKLLGRRGNQKLVKMAAWRDLVPVSWTAIQEARGDEGRILFQHVGGVTRGMAVEWRLESVAVGQTRVSIQHDFAPGWPVVGGRIAQLVIGEFFVRNIAAKTLRRIKLLAEAQHVAANPGRA
jgi:ribosome-associated toxin RatA of RatAB toxin-antitoxin module